MAWVGSVIDLADAGWLSCAGGLRVDIVAVDVWILECFTWWMVWTAWRRTVAYRMRVCELDGDQAARLLELWDKQTDECA